MLPRATMRLQLNKDFTFSDTTELVPYFADLGVSHLYLSPIMAARAGSMHGYDTIDPTRLNPELGSEHDLRRLVQALRGFGMALIVDIVPNHMAVGSDNAWWMDVLARGRDSRYAKYFDIDWNSPDPRRRDKVLLPVLGRPYGEAIAAGEIAVQVCQVQVRQDCADFAPAVRYFDKIFPLSPATAAMMRDISPDAFDPRCDSGRMRLHQLLEQQHYRLAWWRCANDEINWRRFFDINELAAVRVEDDEVFDAVHDCILQLYGQGLIDGLRVDHVDGLAQPGDYCRKLRSRLRTLEKSRPSTGAAGPAYLIVEKILSRDERLPSAWEIDGTTGYDFMDEVSLLQHADAGETPLASFWHRISGRAATFAEEEALARRQILERSFSAQRASLVEVLYQLAQADITTRDFSRATIDRCVTEILVHFPVYRIYSKLDEASAADQHFLGRAMQGAEGTCLPGDRLVLKALGPWLIGRLAPGHAKDLQSVALARFQQLSAPLCAKAVEDTALYRYGRLLSRNDVGFDAGRFACTIDQFHERMRRRRYEFPLAMLATATHDHKRGEDVRARLAVLSECSAEWDRVVAGWLEHARAYSAQIPMAETLSDGDLLILFQTVIGAWSPTLPIDDRDGLASYAKRIAAWQQKALREAKLHTDWIVPNEAYEDAASRFVAQLFEGPSDLLKQIADFAQRLMAAGIANSLSQLIIKLSAPGVPDIYRGTEFWDFSLVDPDNRAPVDFASRNEATESILHEALVANWRDGRLKQHILKKALAARRRVPSLFADGDYMPLVSEGPLAEHVAAYARVLPKASAIIVFSRFTFRFLRDTQLTIRSSDWRDTRLIVPDFLHNSYFDQLTGAGIRIDGKTYVSDLLSRLPVGLFLRFL